MLISKMKKNISVVGAGFSGAVIARELANAGHEVIVHESRAHIGGNSYTERDKITGVMLHVYGPHIFHTSDEHIWNYVQQFDEFVPFINRVKAIYNSHVYSLPINLMTINAFFGKTFSPKEAEEFIRSAGNHSAENPQTFEEQALRFVGQELYEAFFKGYTIKQWGLHPTELPASILKRLPVRFNYDDNYYASKFQGIPRHGYSHVIQNILDHPGIDVKLNSMFTRDMVGTCDHVFYSGPIDAWFGFSEGRLGYRTLDFEVERHEGDYQGNAVINYGNEEVPWTRISEHKHFATWESHEKTIIYKEYSRSCGENDIPYYPVRLVKDKDLLGRYIGMANTEKKTTFVGRLGTYRYLDMHVSISEALNAAKCFLNCQERDEEVPAFIVDPLN